MLQKTLLVFRHDKLTYCTSNNSFMNVKNIALLLLTVLLVSGCTTSKSNTKSQTSSPVQKKTTDTTLDNSDWFLENLYGQPRLLGEPIQLHFAPQGQLTGFAGCNNYSGTYSRTKTGTCQIKKVKLTEKMCQPAALMEQERKLIAHLGKVTSCDLREKKLLLKDEQGTVLATFIPPKKQDLQGTSWKATSFSDGQGGMIPVYGWKWVLTATFGDNDQFSGSAGCNDYLATYKASSEDQSFHFDMIKMTSKQCAPERIMQQEGSFMAALYAARSYQIEDQTLTLKDAEGQPVVVLKRRKS
jgi:heat shock protein HslJ